MLTTPQSRVLSHDGPHDLAPLPNLEHANDSSSKPSFQFWDRVLDRLKSNAGVRNASEDKHERRILHMQSTVSFAQLELAAHKQQLSSPATYLRTAWALLLCRILEMECPLFLDEIEDDSDEPMHRGRARAVFVIPTLFEPKATVLETLKAQDRYSASAWEHRVVPQGLLQSLHSCDKDADASIPTFSFKPEQQDIPSSLVGSLNTNIESASPRLSLNVKKGFRSNFTLEVISAQHMMSLDRQRLLLRLLDEVLSFLVREPLATPESLADYLPEDMESLIRASLIFEPSPDRSPEAWVEKWAITNPDWPAATITTAIEVGRIETTSWTFAQLNTEANNIARMIVGLNLGRRTIGMCLGRTLIAYAVQVAILKTGNVYLPIDESLPQERKCLLLHDSEAAMLFATKDVFEFSSVPATCRLIDVDTEIEARDTDTLGAQDVSIESEPDDSAYLLYTSGSTGTPKGVLVSRKNLSSFVEAWSHFMRHNVTNLRDLEGRGRYLALASRAFDVHIGEVFLAWRHGLATVTGPKSLLLDDLPLVLNSLQITHASFVPSLLDQTGLSPQDAPSLVWLTVGGEKMSSKTQMTWASDERVALINAYGPTEVTIGCCANRILPDSIMTNIGSPLGDCVAHVLVPGTDHYALREESGELCFSGSLVAKGYLNRPDARGFVDDFRGTRLYRTGDMVRVTAYGEIHFLGRRDDQVKIRGQRVELGEVAEKVRLTTEFASDAVAMILEHPALPKSQLVVFVAHTTSSAQTTSELPKIDHENLATTNQTLRQACEKSLPMYMIPDLILLISHIPLAAISGKTDKKCLQQLYASLSLAQITAESISSRPFEDAPQRDLTSDEETVLTLALRHGGSSPQDPSYTTTILELGVDSLSALGLYKGLQELGFASSLAEILANPTLEELAQRRKAPDAAASGGARLNAHLTSLRERSIQPVSHFSQSHPVSRVIPCLPLQETMLAQTVDRDPDEGTNAYVHHMIFEVKKDADVERLLSAWSAVTRQNEIYRTHFLSKNDRFFQLTEPLNNCENAYRPNISEGVDVAATSTTQIADEIMDNITNRPPWRLTHALGPNGRSTLILSIHHALFDASSIAMTLQDVSDVYEGHKLTHRSAYANFVDYVLGVDKGRAREYWQKVLRGWERCSLLESGTERIIAAPVAERTLKRKLSNLDRGAIAAKCTLATVMQCAFGLALAQILKTNDVVFGSVLSGRTVPVSGVDQIMAPCITTIPSRVQITQAEQTIRELLIHHQKANSVSLEYQHISARDIQTWVDASRPLYNCLFSFMRGEMLTNLDSKAFKVIGYESTINNPLSMEVRAEDRDDRLIIRMSFGKENFSMDDATLLLERIEILVDTLLGDPQTTVSVFGLSGPQLQRNHDETFDENHWSPCETDLKRCLAQFVSMSTEQVQKNTPFMYMGIDSVVAVRFARHLRSQGFAVSSSDVVRYNRIGSLSRHLNSGQSIVSSKDRKTVRNIQASKLSTFTSSASTHQVRAGSINYVCTPLQSGMLTQCLASDGALYIHHHAIQLHKHIDPELLRCAWAAVVSELDILRTSFRQVNKAWEAVVHERSTLDWRALCVPDAKAYWHDLSDDRGIFELLCKSAPPHSFTLLNSQQNPVMILSLHHSLYDGLSIDMIWQRLVMKYTQIPITPVTPFYLAARRINEKAHLSVDFWASQLEGYNVSFPHRSETSTLLQRRLDNGSAPIKTKHTQAGFSTRDLCVAAFGKALACLYGVRDVVFGSVIAARHSENEEEGDAIGPVFNTIPVRVRIDDDLATNKDCVQNIARLHMDSIPFQQAPLADVQRAWRSQKAGDGTLIDSIFVYSKAQDPGPYDVRVLGTPLEMDGAPISSEYSLNFEVKENGGSLAVRLISFYPRQDLEHLITVFGEAMKDIADYPMRFAIAHPTRLRDLPSRFDHTTASEQLHNAMDLEKYFDTIRNILAEVSHVPAESITTRTSIHSIGIDSTAAIHVVSLCRKAALKLSSYDLLRGGTAGSICEAVGENARRNDTPVPKTQLRRGISAEQQRRAIDILGVEVCAVQDILPCTPGQEHYIRHWLNSGRTLYEPGWTLRSRERLDAQRMQRAWFHLQTRYPILRTSFVSVEAHEVLQVVMNPTAFEEGNFSIHEEQQSLLSAVKSHARSMAKSASDLFSPPVRLLLIKAGDGDALMFYIHHSLYDAWTMPRLIESLTKFYEHDPQPPIDSGISPLPNPTMRGQEIAPAEQTFWREALLGCEPTILGCTNDDPLDRRQSFSLSQMAGVDQQILQHIWNAHGYSVQHLILVAFARVIATRTATASPIFGLYHAGRSTTDNQDDFPRVNCLPFGLRDVLTNTVATCLDTIKASLISRIPFEQSHPMSACKAQNPSASILPFNTHINLLMHGSRDDSLEQALLQPWFFGAPTEFSSERVIAGRTAVDGLDLSALPRHNLFVDFEVRDDGLFIGSMADRALMDEDTICVFNQDVEKQLMDVMSQLFEVM